MIDTGILGLMVQIHTERARRDSSRAQQWRQEIELRRRSLAPLLWTVQEKCAWCGSRDPKRCCHSSRW